MKEKSLFDAIKALYKRHYPKINPSMEFQPRPESDFWKDVDQLISREYTIYSPRLLYDFLAKTYLMLGGKSQIPHCVHNCDHLVKLFSSVWSQRDKSKILIEQYNVRPELLEKTTESHTPSEVIQWFGEHSKRLVLRAMINSAQQKCDMRGRDPLVAFARFFASNKGLANGSGVGGRILSFFPSGRSHWTPEKVNTRLSDQYNSLERDKAHSQFFSRVTKASEEADKVEILRGWNSYMPVERPSPKKEASIDFMKARLENPSQLSRLLPRMAQFFKTRSDKRTIDKLIDVHRSLRPYQYGEAIKIMQFFILRPFIIRKGLLTTEIRMKGYRMICDILKDIDRLSDEPSNYKSVLSDNEVELSALQSPYSFNGSPSPEIRQILISRLMATIKNSSCRKEASIVVVWAILLVACSLKSSKTKKFGPLCAAIESDAHSCLSTWRSLGEKLDICTKQIKVLADIPLPAMALRGKRANRVCALESGFRLLGDVLKAEESSDPKWYRRIADESTASVTREALCLDNS